MMGVRDDELWFVMCLLRVLLILSYDLGSGSADTASKRRHASWFTRTLPAAEADISIPWNF